MPLAILHAKPTRRSIAQEPRDLLLPLPGISTFYMSDIENDKTNIGLEIFMKLTERLPFSADWLLRTDVPPVGGLYQNEIGSLLEDCSPKELQAVSKIIKEITALLHSQKD